MIKRISESVKRSVAPCYSGDVIISTVLVKCVVKPYYETAILDNNKVIVVDKTYSKRNALANHWFWEKLVETQNPSIIKACGQEVPIDYIIDGEKVQEIYQICSE